MWKIRPAKLDEAEALANLKFSTFTATFLVEFGIPYPPDDLAIFVQKAYSVESIISQLTNSSHMTFVAEQGDGALIGYAHAGPCGLPHPEASPSEGELYQLYVTNEAKGKGLGKELLETSLQWLRANYTGRQWLGVWSGNHRAIRFYESFGFSQVGEYKFMVGNWGDDEFIFRRD